jgi:hypothetical protein
MTVVVVECVDVLPLATASAMAPPATAPPRIGIKRLRRFIDQLLLMTWICS